MQIRRRTGEFAGGRGIRGDPNNFIHLQALLVSPAPFSDTPPRLPPLIFGPGFELRGGDEPTAKICDIGPTPPAESVVVTRPIAWVSIWPASSRKTDRSPRINLTYRAATVKFAFAL